MIAPIFERIHLQIYKEENLPKINKKLKENKELNVDKSQMNRINNLRHI